MPCYPDNSANLLSTWGQLVLCIVAREYVGCGGLTFELICKMVICTDIF